MTVLRDLVRVRFADAEALLRTRVPERRNAAMYMAGYGVECALKAQICVTRDDDCLPAQFFHHDLRRLAEATDKWPAMSGANPQHLDRLTYLESEWRTAMRYAKRNYGYADVVSFIGKAREFTEWLLRP
jgi:hypothetical protein